MTKYIALVLTALFAACSPTPAVSDAGQGPTLVDASPTTAAKIAPTMCGDELCSDVLARAAGVAPATPKPDPRTPAQLAMASCAATDGSWACPAIRRPLMASGNATAAQCGPACTIGSWYLDPQNTTTCASDANSCTSATCGGAGIGPCLTFHQIVTRLGSENPLYPVGQSVTFFFLSQQSAGQDVIFFHPHLSGGGQVVIDARQAWVATGAAFASGALSGGFGYAGAVPSAGGTAMTIAGVPGYVVGKTLLNNTARASYAFVDSVAGGNAAVQQPQTVASLTTMTALPTPTVDNDWVVGDNIQPYTLPTINLKKLEAVGGDLTAGGQPVSDWVLGARIVDPSGTGASVYQMSGHTAASILSVCEVDTRLQFAGQGGRGSALYVNGVTGTAIVVIDGPAEVFGGGFTGATSLGYIELANNAIVHGTISSFTGRLQIASTQAFSDGTFIIYAGSDAEVDGIMWGSYGVTLNPGGIWWNNTGSTFTLKALLTSGGLLLGTVATGSAYSGAGTMIDGISLTPAHIDTGGAGGAGLFNPITGARFCNSN